MDHLEVFYARLDGFRPLALDLHVPEGVEDPPLVVYVHGGGFGLGDRRSQPKAVRPGSIFTALTDAGMACATVDYRLSGEAPWPAQGDDVASALDFLLEHAAEYGYRGDGIGVWGDSAGGHLALFAAVTRVDVRAAVGWFPMTDVALCCADDMGRYSPWLGGRPGDMPDRLVQASPITYVTADSPPVLLVHGDRDSVYPVSQSEVFAARMAEVGAEAVFRRLPGVEHGFGGWADVPGLLAESVEFLRVRLA